MLWFSLTLLAAFAQATADALTKKALVNADFYMVSWLRNVLSIPFLIIIFLFIPIPPLDPTFWWAVGLALPLEVAATLLYTRAIEVSPLSLTMPFLALTPFYLLLTSFLILGETPSLAGAAGVCLLGIGAYLLNVHTLKEGGVFAPFRAIYKEKGSLMMMVVAAIYALTSDLGKLAMLHSSPYFFGPFYVFVFSVVFTPISLGLSKKPLKLPKGELPLYLFIGGSIASLTILQPVALSMTQVSYMIAVKRTSLLFSIGYGYFMFRETRVKERLLGGAVMVAGLIVMAVF
jgi:drug/metabolite transporter (DMT)-like permease